jgi:hypothetical protein
VKEASETSRTHEWRVTGGAQTARVVGSQVGAIAVIETLTNSSVLRRHKADRAARHVDSCGQRGWRCERADLCTGAFMGVDDGSHYAAHWKIRFSKILHVCTEAESVCVQLYGAVSAIGNC